MVIQAQEYASRLQQAQDTIHSLSEPKLQEDDDFMTLNSFSVSSQDGAKESEITKVHKLLATQAKKKSHMNLTN